MKARTLLSAISAAGVAILVACAAPEISGPDDAAQSASLRSSLTSANLIECPTSQSATASGVLGPLGGFVNAGGVSINVPAGALLGDALVTVTVPASRYLEVDISVAGHEHFIFESPVAVTMSYTRCNRSNIDFRPLSAWYIDSATKEPLEQMPSIDNKLLKTVTFTTGHLSGYAVAN